MAARIAVIDDTEDYAAFVVECLRRAGYEAFALPAGGPVTALLAEAHAAQPLDLIVTDIVMPEPDGIEILRFAGAELPGVPVIGMTGRSAYLPIGAVVSTESDPRLLPKSTGRDDDQRQNVSI